MSELTFLSLSGPTLVCVYEMGSPHGPSRPRPHEAVFGIGADDMVLYNSLPLITWRHENKTKPPGASMVTLIIVRAEHKPSPPVRCAGRRDDVLVFLL